MFKDGGNAVTRGGKIFESFSDKLFGFSITFFLISDPGHTVDESHVTRLFAQGLGQKLSRPGQVDSQNCCDVAHGIGNSRVLQMGRKDLFCVTEDTFVIQLFCD